MYVLSPCDNPNKEGKGDWPARRLNLSPRVDAKYRLSTLFYHNELKVPVLGADV